MSDLRKKKRPVKKVQYLVFNSLAQYTVDDYWRQLLASCAIGKFPRYVSYADNFLTHRRGRCHKSIPLSETADSQSAFSEVQDFFKALGLSSDLDNATNQRQIQDRRKGEEIPTFSVWDKIKQPGAKEILIQQYLGDLYVSLHLTNKEYKLLQASITIANLFKYLTAQTVILKDNKISGIQGLEITGEVRGKREFAFPLHLGETTSQVSTQKLHKSQEEDVEVQAKSLTDTWVKYLDALKRKRSFYASLPSY